MIKKLLTILSKPKNILFLIVGFVLVFLLFRTLPFYNQLSSIFDLPGMTTKLKAQTWYEYAIEGFLADGFWTQVLQVLLAFGTVLNGLLFVVYAKRQQKFLRKKTFWGGISGMILGLFGVGCVSCGVFILAPFITFLGLGAYLNFFQSHAVYISLFGLVLVIISCIVMLYKLSKPVVCKV